MSEEPICGKCGLPIHQSETGLRYFGHYIAHDENRCLELLRSQLQAAEGVEAHHEITYSTAEGQEVARLLSCPFCGREPFMGEIPPHKHLIADMPEHHGSWTIECGCGAGLIDDTVEAVTVRWNSRAALSHRSVRGWIPVSVGGIKKHQTYIVKVRTKDGNIFVSVGVCTGEQWERLHVASEYQDIENCNFSDLDMEVVEYMPLPELPLSPPPTTGEAGL